MSCRLSQAFRLTASRAARCRCTVLHIPSDFEKLAPLFWLCLHLMSRQLLEALSQFHCRYLLAEPLVLVG